VNPYRWSLLGLVSTVVLMLMVSVAFWPLLLLDVAWLVAATRERKGMHS
jgi:hypothetical protein